MRDRETAAWRETDGERETDRPETRDSGKGSGGSGRERWNPNRGRGGGEDGGTECGNQETQRREGVSNGVREDTEVREGRRQGWDGQWSFRWEGDPEMGQKREQTRVRPEEGGQSEMVREGVRRDGRGGSDGHRPERRTKREEGGETRREEEIHAGRRRDEKVGGYRRQAQNWKAGTHSHPESGKHQPQEEGMEMEESRQSK